MNLNSLYRHNFEIKTDMNLKICSHTILCTQNKILDSKMQKLKQIKHFRFGALGRSYLEKVDCVACVLEKDFTSSRTRTFHIKL